MMQRWMLSAAGWESPQVGFSLSSLVLRAAMSGVPAGWASALQSGYPGNGIPAWVPRFLKMVATMQTCGVRRVQA